MRWRLYELLFEFVQVEQLQYQLWGFSCENVFIEKDLCKTSSFAYDWSLMGSDIGSGLLFKAVCFDLYLESQCPRADLNKKILPRPKTTIA